MQQSQPTICPMLSDAERLPALIETKSWAMVLYVSDKRTD